MTSLAYVQYLPHHKKCVLVLFMPLLLSPSRISIFFFILHDAMVHTFLYIDLLLVFVPGTFGRVVD